MRRRVDGVESVHYQYQVVVVLVTQSIPSVVKSKVLPR